ncbi:MAG: hypothetical protein LC122_14895 [Chitinophagales bacterium]|nr:hypothetical protein [Chitinophagales bacterium]
MIKIILWANSMGYQQIVTECILKNRMWIIKESDFRVIYYLYVVYPSIGWFSIFVLGRATAECFELVNMLGGSLMGCLRVRMV